MRSEEEMIVDQAQLLRSISDFNSVYTRTAIFNLKILAIKLKTIKRRNFYRLFEG